MKPKYDDYDPTDFIDKDKESIEEENELDKMSKELESFGEPESVRRIFQKNG